MTAPDATPEAVLALAEELWADSASPGAAPTDAHHEQARVVLASSWLAQRDARIRAEALRLASDRMPAFHDGTEPKWAIEAACDWLRERADRVERGESR